MAEFLILPDAFVNYVTAFKKIPIPLNTPLEPLMSVIETVALEALLDGAEPEPSRAKR